jgi:hypothetical protein
LIAHNQNSDRFHLKKIVDALNPSWQQADEEYADCNACDAWRVIGKGFTGENK